MAVVSILIHSGESGLPESQNNRAFRIMIKLRDARKIIDVFIPYLPLLPKIKNNIFFHEIKAIKTDSRKPASIIHNPIVDISLKKIQTINPKTMEKIEASIKPCLNDLIFSLVSSNSFLKLNFVDSIDGRLLSVLILSPSPRF